MTRTSFTIEGEAGEGIVVNAFKTFVLLTRVEKYEKTTMVFSEEIATKNDCLVHTAIIVQDNENPNRFSVVWMTAGLGNEKQRQSWLLEKMEEVFQRNGYVHSPFVTEKIDWENNGY